MMILENTIRNIKEPLKLEDFLLECSFQEWLESKHFRLPKLDSLVPTWLSPLACLLVSQEITQQQLNLNLLQALLPSHCLMQTSLKRLAKVSEAKPLMRVHLN